MRTNAFVAAIVVAGVVLVGCSSSARQRASATTPIAEGSSTSTSTTADADLASESAADSKDAAITYVASTDELMAHSSIGRREILRKLVTAASLDAQATAFEQTADQLSTTLKVPVEGLAWVEAPLTATTTAVTPTSASVDVWTVSILGSPTSGWPQQVWRTVHVGLQLVNGRWLVSTAEADAGPTPAANELAMQSDWKDFDLVASWPAVVEGVGL